MPISCLLAVPLLILLQNGAHADEVRLKNGDRISGSIINKQGDTLTVKTSYAGNIILAWDMVDSFTTDGPVRFEFSDDTTINGKAATAESGTVKIVGNEYLALRSIALKEIRTISTAPPEAKQVKLSGKINIGLDISKGNSDNERIHLDGEMTARTKKNRFRAGGSFDRLKDSGIETEANTTAYMKYDHFLDTKWYLSANTALTKDKYKDLNLRTLIGLAVGYQFLESEKTNLAVEAGLNYTNEDHIDQEDESYPAARWALNYDRYLFQDLTQFFHSHEIYFGLEDAEDINLRAQTGFRVPLVHTINASIQYNIDWDNTPARNTKKTDEKYLFALGYFW